MIPYVSATKTTIPKLVVSSSDFVIRKKPKSSGSPPFIVSVKDMSDRRRRVFRGLWAFGCWGFQGFGVFRVLGFLGFWGFRV